MTLQERIRLAGEMAFVRARRDGTLRARAELRPLALPGVTARALEDAWDTGSPSERERLEFHYFDVMPQQHIEVLYGAGSAQERVMHTPLDWEQLPRLRGGLEALFDLLRTSGVAPEPVLGVPDVAGLIRRGPTLAEFFAHTCFGAFAPPLRGLPGDLADCCALAEQVGLMEAIDRCFAAPMLHEVCHLARFGPEVPPIVDECLSGYLGVWCYRATAYPGSATDRPLYGAPWFAQIGQAVVGAFGLRHVVRAHAGVEPLLGSAGLSQVHALARRRWEPRREVHFLSGNTDPDAWVALFLALGKEQQVRGEYHRPEFVRQCIRDAFDTMALDARLDGGSMRVFAAVRPPGTVRVVDGWLESVARPMDLAPPRYLLPPSVAERVRSRLGRAPVGLEQVLQLVED